MQKEKMARNAVRVLTFEGPICIAVSESSKTPIHKDDFQGIYITFIDERCRSQSF